MTEKTCPFGHTCENCKLYTHLRGTNPQTGQEIDNNGCAIVFQPMLLIENSQQQKQTAAAVEATRNAVVAAVDKLMTAMVHAAAGPMIGSHPDPMRISGLNGDDK